MNQYKVTRIELIDPRGAFQEWAEGAGDEHPKADIDRWQSEYYKQIVDRLGEYYPYATITMEEGHDQGGMKHYSTVKLCNDGETADIEAEDDMMADIEAEEQVQDIFTHAAEQVANAGTFWA